MRERLDAPRVRRLLAELGRYAETDGAYHFDPYSQALAKLERGLDHDLADVDALIQTGLVERTRLRDAFEEIAPRLYRFPGIDPGSFRLAVERAAGS